MELTKRFKLKGNTHKNNKLKIELTSVINEGGKSKDTLNIEIKFKNLLMETLPKPLSTGKTLVFLKTKGQAELSSILRMKKGDKIRVSY